VKQIRKFILTGVVFAAILAVNLHVGAAVSDAADGAVSEATAVASAPAEEGVPAAAPAVFHVFGLPITNSMICTWIVAAIILIVVRATTPKRIQEIPSGMQNVLEALVEGWEGLMGEILDPRVTRWVFPFATTFFIFIIVCNLVDVIPGVGSIGVGTPVADSSLPLAVHMEKPFFRPPTSDANLTIAMAGVFLVMSLFWAIRYNGFGGLIKHIFGVKVETNKWLFPLFLVMFLFIGVMDLVSVLFARPVALAMRLYGNIFAGSTIMDMTFHVKNWVLSILLSLVAYGYDVFVCLVQAFVFGILVVAFVATMCSHPEESSHD
jgi:F-type H+-transporting ATPase subunit a